VEGMDVGWRGAHFMRLWTPSLPILKAVGWTCRRSLVVGIGEAKDLDLGKACWLVVVESSVRRIVDASVIVEQGAKGATGASISMLLGVAGSECDL